MLFTTGNATITAYKRDGNTVPSDEKLYMEDYGGSLADLAKVVMNMQSLLDSSVLLEIHKDKAKGTPKENARLMKTYVLLSAFKENEYVTPVQFEVKQYIDNENRLYLAVALTKIETGVMDDTALLDEERTRLIPVSGYSIPQLVEKINPKDRNFFKYIPDEFLSAAQKEAKRSALEKEAKKYRHDLNADDTIYQEQDDDSISNRSLLANALESAAKEGEERNILRNYKTKLRLIEAEQAKLADVREKAHDLRFKKGRTAEETKTLNGLDLEAKQIAKRTAVQIPKKRKNYSAICQGITRTWQRPSPISRKKSLESSTNVGASTRV